MKTEITYKWTTGVFVSDRKAAEKVYSIYWRIDNYTIRRVIALPDEWFKV